MTSDEQTDAGGDVTGRWGGQDIAFGEHGARLTYGSYLQLERLLSSQDLESVPPAHDELLFITIHQVYELWFQQLLHEATAVRDALLRPRDDEGDRLWFAQHLLTRMHVIERVLIQQVDVLETMTPPPRKHLAGAAASYHARSSDNPTTRPRK